MVATLTRADCLSIVFATQAIANVVKSSFGPSGLDKMMVDDIGVSLMCLPKFEAATTDLKFPART